MEQTETPRMLAERNANTKAVRGQTKDKVVNREMCSILTQGTLVDESLLGGQAEATFLLALCEEQPAVVSARSSGGGAGRPEHPPAFVADTRLGVCFVDTATATFTVGQFDDDKTRTRLRTLLAQLDPKEVVRPRTLSKKTTEVPFP